MRIVPQRLRAIRTERGLSRRELANRSVVSEKQIQRLEFPEQASRTVRPDTLDRLANALGVQPEQLTGEPPTQPDAKTTRLGAALVPGVRLAYELIERRYGITVGQLLNAAPLLFALLAEGSLEWRRAQLAELRATVSRLRQSGGPRRDRYGAYARELEEAGDQEEAGISDGNLFDDPLDVDYDHPEFFDELIRNPFADYLANLAQHLRGPELVDLDPDFHGRVGGNPGIPAYRVYSEDLSRVAPLDSDAMYALHSGDSLLSEIPDELMTVDAADERRRWLERRLSPESRRWLDARHRTSTEIESPADSRVDPDAAATGSGA